MGGILGSWDLLLQAFEVSDLGGYFFYRIKMVRKTSELTQSGSRSRGQISRKTRQRFPRERFHFRREAYGGY
jgi:hypothetical protein